MTWLLSEPLRLGTLGYSVQKVENEECPWGAGYVRRLNFMNFLNSKTDLK